LIDITIYPEGANLRMPINGAVLVPAEEATASASLDIRSGIAGRSTELSVLVSSCQSSFGGECPDQ